MPFSYKHTLDYLYEQLPMFHRVGAAAYKANLDNTLAIDEILNYPHRSFKTIHVGGTNGKGSTSHMLAAILREAGYKTGLYTSPHLKDFRERIRVNGKMISKNYVTAFVEKYADEFERMKPSFFEWTVGLAFEYFRNQKVDVAVIEVGLGGRLDSTNIISPVISVITNIGWDHMNLLGNTLEKIAIEKAGIIKKETPVVIGELKPETVNIFSAKARKENASIYFAGKKFKAVLKKDFSVSSGKMVVDVFHKEKKYLKNLELDLTGIYQLKNVCTVLQALQVQTDFLVKEKDIRQALRNVKQLTGLRGRWEIISKKPLTICDIAHNADGIAEVLQQIKSIKFLILHFVLGIVNDKDVSEILKLLPRKAIYYFCKADIPRGMDALELASRAIAIGLNGNIYPSVRKAKVAAQENAGKKDLVFIGGSTFVVAEAL